MAKLASSLARKVIVAAISQPDYSARDSEPGWREHDAHPLIRSYEPGEDWWWWCYPDELFFEVDDAPPAPFHP